MSWLASLTGTKAAAIDAHVHFYNCFSHDRFLDHAYFNLSEASRRLGRSDDGVLRILMLAETSEEHYFARCAGQAASLRQSDELADDTRWRFYRTEEECSLVACKKDRAILVIAGRQVATAEDMEVLILGTERIVSDGLPIGAVLESAMSMKAIHVIPWGAGKWLFRRGGLLSRLMESRTQDGFYLGDQGGRPVLWPTPRHLRKAEERGIRILPGADPLPFPEEISRVGSYGFLMEASVDPLRPAAAIRAILRNPEVSIVRFGRRQQAYRFIATQLKMQVRKRRRLLHARTN